MSCHETAFLYTHQRLHPKSENLLSSQKRSLAIRLNPELRTQLSIGDLPLILTEGRSGVTSH
jgi:hypothetical protein